jgi:purine-binding chemotaxis protein CheW
VVEIETKSQTVQIGIVVDAVSEVLNITTEDFEETPTFGIKMNTDYILGMAKMEDSIKILLDIDQILLVEEIETLMEAA